MILPINVYGSAILKKPAEPVPSSYSGLSLLISDMFKTMYAANGVGLAAPQIGHSLQLFVIDTSEMLDEDSDESPIKKVFINAVITSFQGEDYSFQEGCLSVPGINENVIRKSGIFIEYFDENFNHHKEHFTAMAARVIQHEYDHTLGITFIDRLPSLKKTLLKGKLSDIMTGKKTTFYKTKIIK